jgi:hypothetical protein
MTTTRVSTNVTSRKIPNSTGNQKARNWKCIISSVLGISILFGIAGFLVYYFVFLNQKSENQPIVLQVEEEEVSLDAGQAYFIPKSKENQVFMLMRKANNAKVMHDMPAARSYDGNGNLYFPFSLM